MPPPTVRRPSLDKVGAGGRLAIDDIGRPLDAGRLVDTMESLLVQQRLHYPQGKIA
jgi:hypothetical protein